MPPIDFKDNKEGMKHKFFIPEEEVQTFKRKDENGNEYNEYRFIASTSSVDRDHDIIDVNGWQLKNFKKNGPILWMHDWWGLPIGTGRAVIETDDEGKAVLAVYVRFSKTYDLAIQIENMVKEKIIKAVSVGFGTLKYTRRKDLDEEHWAYGAKGWYVEKADLWEVSLVTIPANQDAVGGDIVKSLIGRKGAEKILGLLEKIVKHLGIEEEKEDPIEDPVDDQTENDNDKSNIILDFFKDLNNEIQNIGE